MSLRSNWEDGHETPKNQTLMRSTKGRGKMSREQLILTFSGLWKLCRENFRRTWSDLGKGGVRRKGAPGSRNNTNKGETVRKLLFQEGELFRVARGACI